MPFGNSYLEEIEVNGTLPGLVLLKSWPVGDWATHGPGTSARLLAWLGEIAAGSLQEALGQLLLLVRAQQITAQRQGQPQGPHQFEQLDKAQAQHRRLAFCRSEPLARQQRAGQHNGRNFLGAGLQGVAWQHVGFAQLAFEFPVIQFVFPAPGIKLDQFQGGCRLRIQQAGPQTQPEGAKARSLDARTDFAQFKPLDNDALVAFLLYRHTHQPAAILQALEDLPLDFGARESENGSQPLRTSLGPLR